MLNRTGSNPERQPSHLYNPRLIAFVLLASGTAIYANTRLAHQQDPTTLYRNNYTDGGKCLDLSPYTEAHGASVISRQIGKAMVITVIPETIQNDTPDLLNFLVNIRDDFQPPKLTPADHRTAAYLAGQCGVDVGY